MRRWLAFRRWKLSEDLPAEALIGALRYAASCAGAWCKSAMYENMIGCMFHRRMHGVECASWIFSMEVGAFES